MKVKEVLSDSYFALLKEYGIIRSEDDEIDMGVMFRDLQSLYLELSYYEDKEYEMMLIRGILEILDGYDFE